MATRLSPDNIAYYEELVLSRIPLEPCGKHHKDIASELGMGKSFVRHIIKLLREDGYPICSNSCDGYWIARTSDEIQSMINLFNSYIKSMQHTVAALNDKKLEKLKEEKML